MSDVSDVNRFAEPPLDDLSRYIFAAEKMLSQNSSMADRMAFNVFHKPANVVALGNLIARLRAENAALLEALYGPDEDQG